MRLLAFIAVTLFAVLLFSGSPHAQHASKGFGWSGSTMCMYGVLLESHVMAGQCDVALDMASEQRYRKLIAAVRENILSNTNADQKAITAKRLDGYEATLIEHHRHDGTQICHSKDYVQSRSMLVEFTSRKTARLILKHFAGLTQNPYEGDCF